MPVVLLTTMVLAASMQTANAFTGRWALDVQSCRDELAAGSLLVVTPFSLRWREAACVVRSSYLVRDAWHVGARCWADGATGNVAIRLRRQKEQLVLDWSGAPSQTLRRCP
jgi:hypothetical protein